MALHRESIIVRIDCDPPALLWSGIGNLAVPADDVVPAPALAVGGGELVSVPDFQQLIGGTAERLEFVVSGVSPETIRLAVEDAESVRGARVDVGTVLFDAAWQLVSVTWENVFEARTLAVSRPASDEAGNVSQSVTLTIVQGVMLGFYWKIDGSIEAEARREESTAARLDLQDTAADFNAEIDSMEKMLVKLEEIKRKFPRPGQAEIAARAMGYPVLAEMLADDDNDGIENYRDPDYKKPVFSNNGHKPEPIREPANFTQGRD